MFNSKKGVSEVVANVLIVLLVIVGIAVIWSVVKPTIDKGAAGIQSDCFTVLIGPVSCVPNVDGNVDQWDVVIKRNPGSGTLDGVDLLFEDDSGAQRVENALTSLNELESKTVTSPVITLTGNGLKVNTVLKSNGQLCQITSQPVNCVV